MTIPQPDDKPTTNSTQPPNGTIHSPLSPTQTAWSHPGPAAFDFRSDVVTTPTPSMLAAITKTTLLDDVFQEDPTTRDLEAWMAELTGNEAGLLVLSGTMGNQLSMRTHLGGPPHSVLADKKSHVLGWEAGFLSSLSGAFPIAVTPANNHHLTLNDIKTHTILPSSNPHACPTTLITLENTLFGSILPLSECQSISQWTHSQNPPIMLHLDGARLWEAVAAGAGSLKDYCTCFDSVSLCFSKGLGAPIGSMIVGSKSFIQRARHVRKGLGGGLRQAGVISAPARVSVEETFLGGGLKRGHEVAKRVGEMWVRRGGKLEREVETNMCWFDLGAVDEGKGGEGQLEGGKAISQARFAEIVREEGVRLEGGRCVIHYQICEEAIESLGRVMDRVLGAPPASASIPTSTSDNTDPISASIGVKVGMEENTVTMNGNGNRE